LTEAGPPQDESEQVPSRTVKRVRVLKKEPKTGAEVSRYDLSARPPKARTRKNRSLGQLYEEAERLGIHGRSDMNKQELQREVDRKKRQ
jgi:hypothetical protein